MRNFALFLCALILLSACVTTPDSVRIQATVESAVSTAVAPYEARYSEFVTSEQLDAFKNEQNEMVKSQIMDQIEMYKSSLNLYPEPTATTYVEPGTIYEYSGGQSRIVPTETSKTYKSDASCVDRLTYVSDITVPDGMNVTPHTNFTKSWYITNSGDCIWNSSYRLVYSDGAKVGKAQSFSILQPGYYIQPGESLVVSADLIAPSNVNQTYTTYWALQSDRGEVFGAGDAKNVFLSSRFTVSENFVVAQNFSSLTCSDDSGYITCGLSNLSGGRGVVYYDETPMLESTRSGRPAIVAGPPTGRDNSSVRFEFGPLRFPRGSWFYTNFCCRPDTPHCDVTVKLYVKEPGYDWRLVQEAREWNDGLMSEWKFRLDDLSIFDQDFYYAIEVTSNGGATEEDLIMFPNFWIY